MRLSKDQVEQDANMNENGRELSCSGLTEMMDDSKASKTEARSLVEQDAVV